MNGNRYFAEAMGTFALVFAGTGAIIVNDQFGGALGHVGVSMVFGLVVMAMIYATGNISGAHLNPAVMSGNLEHLWLYLIAPVIGTILARPTCKWTQSDDCCPPKLKGETG